MRGTRYCLAVVAAAVVGWGSLAPAAPISDGSYFEETFTAYPEDPNSAAIGPGANVVSGVMHIETVTASEGVFRAANINIPAATEFVIEYDYRVNAASGNNFFLLYTQGPSSPWEQDILLRVYEDNSSPSTWEFQVDDASPPTWHQYGGFNYGQWYHFTVHHTNNANNDIALYIDGSLVGTFKDRAPGLDLQLAQFGDSSAGAGYGNADVDNVSIGAPVPEPTGLAFLAVGAAALRRRRVKA